MKGMDIYQRYSVEMIYFCLDFLSGKLIFYASKYDSRLIDKQVLMLNKGSGTGSRLCSPTNLVPAWRHVEVALTALFKIWDDEDENENENTQVTLFAILCYT